MLSLFLFLNSFSGNVVFKLWASTPTSSLTCCTIQISWARNSIFWILKANNHISKLIYESWVCYFWSLVCIIFCLFSMFLYVFCCDKNCSKYNLWESITSWLRIGISRCHGIYGLNSFNFINYIGRLMSLKMTNMPLIKSILVI